MNRDELVDTSFLPPYLTGEILPQIDAGDGTVLLFARPISSGTDRFEESPDYALVGLSPSHAAALLNALKSLPPALRGRELTAEGLDSVVPADYDGEIRGSSLRIFASGTVDIILENEFSANRFTIEPDNIRHVLPVIFHEGDAWMLDINWAAPESFRLSGAMCVPGKNLAEIRESLSQLDREEIEVAPEEVPAEVLSVLETVLNKSSLRLEPASAAPSPN